MERIKALDRFQKIILLVLAAMLVFFTAAYALVSSQVGYRYLDEILLPGEENGNTVYAGTIAGEESRFVVTPEKEVTFYHGSKVYGPYTAKEDPTARPEDEPYLTGVEIRDGDEIFFRGGVWRSQDGFILYGADGGIIMDIMVYTEHGNTYDSDGNVVDHMEPSAPVLLELMEGPVLTHQGDWTSWIVGVFISFVTAFSILFADELFQLRFAFRVQNPELIEPSDWEIATRFIGWTGMTIMVLVCFIMGLQ